MTLIPSLEIGVWNLWIFMVAWLFFHMAPLDWPIFRYDIKARFKKSSASPSYSQTEKTISNFEMIIWFVLFIYSIFLPLPLGTPLLYAGIALFVVGLIIFETAGVSWAKTAIDEPITGGIYRYSRHPIYIGVFVQQIGIGIASASGLFLLLTFAHIALSILVAPTEERLCCEKYGDVYREYMNRTPRWLGAPK